MLGGTIVIIQYVLRGTFTEIIGVHVSKFSYVQLCTGYNGICMVCDARQVELSISSGGVCERYLLSLKNKLRYTRYIYLFNIIYLAIITNLYLFPLAIFILVLLA